MNPKLNNVKFYILMIIVIALVFVGCTKRQIVLTPYQEANRAYFEAKDQHTQAVKLFTKSLMKYNEWCEKPEYGEICAKIDSYVIKANTALNTWGAVVESRKDDTAANDDYVDALKEIKSKLLMEAPNFIW